MLQSFTASSRQETREAAAHLLGVLSDHLSMEELSQLAQDLLKDAASEVIKQCTIIMYWLKVICCFRSVHVRRCSQCSWVRSPSLVM